MFRGMEGAEPLREDAATGPREVRRDARTTHLASGTLACPRCDAPVAPPAGRSLRPAHHLGCPYCAHAARVRDFLSLATPARPARVEVHVIPARRRTSRT